MSPTAPVSATAQNSTAAGTPLEQWPDLTGRQLLHPAKLIHHSHQPIRRICSRPILNLPTLYSNTGSAMLHTWVPGFARCGMEPTGKPGQVAKQRPSRPSKQPSTATFPLALGSI